MARYPTFEEYQKSGKYPDGLKRTNDLLKKSPNDRQLLILKLQFLAQLKQDLSPAITALQASQPPIQDLDDLVEIENAIVNSQRDDYPPPTTSGPLAAKFWDTAAKAASTQNVKLDILSLRFARAIAHARLTDAQQALIQLKAQVPKNRVVYLAHAAVTYLLSKEKGDMQARLALMLAKKAVKEEFEKGDPALDVRVVGQIFVGAAEGEDLRGVVGTRFGECKQVYEAVRRVEINERKDDGKGKADKEDTEVKEVPSDSLEAQVAKKKEAFARLVKGDAESSAVLQFATSSIRLFAEATKTMQKDDRKRVKADACFLSISALVHLFSRSKDNSTSSRYLLVATYLAETLLRQNENIHEARLILVYFYMRLNLGSLALQMFDSLHVKEVQNDTVGHALYTDISLTLPFTTGETSSKKNMSTEALDPKKMAANALTVYPRHERKLRETEAAVLSHGQTGMIFDLEELSSALRTSLSRRIILLEQRRLARLVEGGTGEEAGAIIGPRITANWLDVTDNRDFRATFDFGVNVERVLYGDRDGIVLAREWVLQRLVTDTAWCLALGKEASVLDVEALVEEAERLQPALSSLKVDNTSDDDPEIPAKAEAVSFDIALSVLRLLLHLRSPTTSNENQKSLDTYITSLRTHISRIPTSLLSAASSPTPSTTSQYPTTLLRSFYITLDALRVVEKAAASSPPGGGPAMTKLPAASTTALGELKNLAQMKRAQLQTCARVLRDSVKAGEIKALMVDEKEILDAIAPLNGVRDLDGFCKDVVAAAREGWEGVGRVKV